LLSILAEVNVFTQIFMYLNIQTNVLNVTMQVNILFVNNAYKYSFNPISDALAIVYMHDACVIASYLTPLIR